MKYVPIYDKLSSVRPRFYDKVRDMDKSNAQLEGAKMKKMKIEMGGIAKHYYNKLVGAKSFGFNAGTEFSNIFWSNMEKNRELTRTQNQG